MHPVFSRVLNFFDLGVAGDLFSLPDEVITQNLDEVGPKIAEIISNPSYLLKSNQQSVVEMCVTRITAAVRDSGSIRASMPELLSLLQTCLLGDLRPPSDGTDSPVAKLASDLINCIFLNYSDRRLMELAVPVGVKFLRIDHTELARNVACYISLITIQLPYLIAPHIPEILAAMSEGNVHLMRILPQLYSLNPAYVMDFIPELIPLVKTCSQSEKDGLFHTVSLVTKSSPQRLWPVVGDLLDAMRDPSISSAVIRIFNTIAADNAVPFVSQLGRLKAAVDTDRHLAAQAASVFGNIAKLGEAVARDCLHYLVSRYAAVDPGSAAVMTSEIQGIMDRYPSLEPEGKLLLSKQVGSTSLVDTLHSFTKPLPPDLRDASSKNIRSMFDMINTLPPPPYHTIESGDNSQRAHFSQPSPFSSRSHGLGKSAFEIRGLSGRSRQSIFSSASHVPTRFTLPGDSLLPTDGNRGLGGTDLNSKASYKSLLSKGNSRRSLASSGIQSAMNNRGSKQSVAHSRQQLSGSGRTTGSFPELAVRTGHLPSLSPVRAGRPEDYGVIGEPDVENQTRGELPTFVVENPYLSKSTETVHVRSRRNSRHSLAPRPRSRLLENNNQAQVIQVVPIHDAVYQFCERNLEKIKKYMNGVLVKFPLPVRCAVELKNSKKHCKLYFGCQCKGDQCLYANRFFTIRSRIPKVWIHLMFLAVQARNNIALNQQDSSVHGLKLCWDHLNMKQDFSTLVTSAFPSSKEQEELLQELSSARYFDVFEYNATIKSWGCFLCNYPEKATAIFANGTPVMEGVLKEKRGRWRIFKRWRTRYFTLSGPYLSYKSNGEKVPPIDMRRSSVKAVNAKGIRSVPTVFEIFTHERKKLLLKTKDPSTAEHWLRSLQIAMVQNHSEEYGRIL